MNKMNVVFFTVLLLSSHYVASMAVCGIEKSKVLDVKSCILHELGATSPCDVVYILMHNSTIKLTKDKYAMPIHLESFIEWCIAQHYESTSARILERLQQLTPESYTAFAHWTNIL